MPMNPLRILVFMMQWRPLKRNVGHQKEAQADHDPKNPRLQNQSNDVDVQRTRSPYTYRLKAGNEATVTPAVTYFLVVRDP